MPYDPLCESDSESEQEARPQDPAYCLERRKQARRAFTSVGTKINRVIQAQGSRQVLNAYKSDLDQLTGECLKWHRLLTVCDPAITKEVATRWEERLRLDCQSYADLIKAYFLLRSNEESPSQPLASRTRSRKVANIEALEKQKEEIEIQRAKLDQQKSHIEEQIESLHLLSGNSQDSFEEDTLGPVPEVIVTTASNRPWTSTPTPVTSSSTRTSGRPPRQSFDLGVPSIVTFLDPMAPVFRPGTHPQRNSGHQVRFSVPSDEIATAANGYQPALRNSTSLMLDHDISFWKPSTRAPVTSLVWSNPTNASSQHTVASAMPSSNPFSSAYPPLIPPRSPAPSHSDPSSIPYHPVSSLSEPAYSPPQLPDIYRAIKPKIPRADQWMANPNVSSSSEPPVPVRHPRLKTPTFNGDPKEWLKFAASFHATVHRATTYNVYRLSMLRDALSPTVQKSIQHFLLDPSLYEVALGRPHLVAEAHIASLKQLPPVADNDPQALQYFVAQLNGAVTALTIDGFEHELAIKERLNLILNRLPQRIRVYWGMMSTDLEDEGILPTMSHLLECLKRATRIEAGSAGTMVLPPNDLVTSKQDRPEKSAAKGASQKFPAQKKTSASVYAVVETSGSTDIQFLACDGPHHSEACRSFTSLSLDDKVAKLKEKKACYRCLLRSHRGSDRTRGDERGGVEDCPKKHHPSIHGVGRIYPPKGPGSSEAKPLAKGSPKPASSSPSSVSATVLLTSTTPLVALNVVPIIVEANERKLHTYALLDSGSSTTIVHDKVRQALGIEGTTTSCSLSTLGGPTEVPCRVISFSIFSVDRSARCNVERGLLLEHPDMPRRSFNPSLLKVKWPYLADLPFDSRNTIRAMVLIGRDVDGAIDVIEIRRPPEGSVGSIAERTAFGWSVVGPFLSESPKDSISEVHVVAESSPDENLNELVVRSFDIDFLGLSPRIKPLMSAEDRHGLAILESRTRHTRVRYQIGLMWKHPDVSLPNNYSIAHRRLLSLERKFKNNPAMASRYAAVIDEYIRLGHARKVKPDELPFPIGRHWFLPHLAVEQPSKTRVVFDISSRHQGTCLNDVLLTGPDLLVSLLELFTRFRLNLIPLSADIEKMYHQVLVEEQEQPFFAFLWRSPGSSAPPDVYVMTVHIFGAISSPATCMFALRKTAEDFRSSFPEVADLVLNNFYVDNYLDSVDSVEDAVRIQQQLTALLQLGGFRLTKWLSSSREVLSCIPAEIRSKPTLRRPAHRKDAWPAVEL